MEQVIAEQYWCNLCNDNHYHATCPFCDMKMEYIYPGIRKCKNCGNEIEVIIEKDEF